MRSLESAIRAAIFTLICAALMPGAEKKTIYPPGAKLGGSWSYGILTDNTVYISGMGGENASGKIPTDFEAEVQQSPDNIVAVLKAGGMLPSDVVSVRSTSTTEPRSNAWTRCT
jgi:enamine deaminase RidA (YjgF/YER057c/UK114 family)